MLMCLERGGHTANTGPAWTLPRFLSRVRARQAPVSHSPAQSHKTSFQIRILGLDHELGSPSCFAFSRAFILLIRGHVGPLSLHRL